MIEIKGLSRSFGQIKAVDRVSFAVKSGEIVGFLGPNGAGKTTTMRMMVGYLQPDEGSIELDGHSVFDDPITASARIGYLPEHNPLYPEMSVGEFLIYLGHLRRMKEAKLGERLEFVREACGLDEVWNQRIATLSKGYRQRTGLAGAKAALIACPQSLPAGCPLKRSAIQAMARSAEAIAVVAWPVSGRRR